MDTKIKELKKKYDAISEQVLELHNEQQEIIQSIQEICPHTDTREVEPDPYDYEDTKKFKCRGCYRYFTEDELATK